MILNNVQDDIESVLFTKWAKARIYKRLTNPSLKPGVSQSKFISFFAFALNIFSLSLWVISARQTLPI